MGDGGGEITGEDLGLENYCGSQGQGFVCEQCVGKVGEVVDGYRSAFGKVNIEYALRCARWRQHCFYIRIRTISSVSGGDMHPELPIPCKQIPVAVAVADPDMLSLPSIPASLLQLSDSVAPTPLSYQPHARKANQGNSPDRFVASHPQTRPSRSAAVWCPVSSFFVSISSHPSVSSD